MTLRRKTSNASTPLAPVDIPGQVKMALLLTYGMDNPDPGTLATDKFMSDFNFNDFQWIKLANRLSIIIQAHQPGQTVTVPELQNTITVQDCIDLVTKKSDPS